MHIYVHIIFAIINPQYVFAFVERSCVSGVTLGEVRSSAERSGSPAGA